jgi:CheY-like chemotaxis protein
MYIMDENLLAEKVILVVDDEHDLRDIVASEFEFMGATVFQAENISVAQEHLKKHKIDLIVSDIRMPGGTGIDLLDKVKAQDVSFPPILLITGFADITTEDAFAKGAEALINKPFKLDDLIQTAVRFTCPKNEKFSHETQDVTQKCSVNMEKSLSESLAEKIFAFGRGGSAVKVDSKNLRLTIGEPTNLQIRFTDFEISAIAVPRWVKHLDKETKSIVGFEYLTLDSATMKRLEENNISFIPSLS